MFSQKRVLVLISVLPFLLLTNGCFQDQESQSSEPSIQIEAPSTVKDTDHVLLKVLASNFNPTHFEWTVENEGGWEISHSEQKSNTYNPSLSNIGKDTEYRFTVKAYQGNRVYSAQHYLLVTDSNTPPVIENIELPDEVNEHDSFKMTIIARDEQDDPSELSYRVTGESLQGEKRYYPESNYYSDRAYNEMAFEVGRLEAMSTVKFSVDVFDTENKKASTSFEIEISPTDNRLGDYVSKLGSTVSECLLESEQGYTHATPIDQITELNCKDLWYLDISRLQYLPNLQSIDLDFKSRHEDLDLSSLTTIRHIKIEGRKVEVFGVNQLKELRSIDLNVEKIIGLNLSESSKIDYVNLKPSNAAASVKFIKIHPDASPSHISINNMYLTSLDIPDKTQLEYFALSDRTSWRLGNFGENLDLSQAEPLEYFYVRSDHLQLIDLSGLNHLKEVSVMGSDTRLQLTDTSLLTHLKLDDVNISNLGFLNEQQLQELSLVRVDADSPLINFESDSLTYAIIKHTQIINIDLSGANTLTELELRDYQVETIKLPETKPLVKLSIIGPSIDEWSLTNYVQLEELILNTGMTEFHLNNSPKLLKLNLNNNNTLTTLNLSGVDNLESLSVNKNNLSTIDLTDFNNLKTFNAANNSFSKIDLADLPIRNLDLSNNNLTFIDFPNAWVEGFRKSIYTTVSVDISNNQLTSLWSDEAKIRYFKIIASGNALTSFPFFGKVSYKLELRNNDIQNIEYFLNKPINSWPENLVLEGNENILCTTVETIRSNYLQNKFPYGYLSNYSLPAKCLN